MKTGGKKFPARECFRIDKLNGTYYNGYNANVCEKEAED